MIIEGAEPFFLPAESENGVLLLHGFTGLPAELRPLGDYLHARGFSVLAVRLTGHATVPEDLARQTKEDWVDSVRDGYALLSGAAKNISVVGHSMGGLLALLLAAEKKIARVVTLAAAIEINPEIGIDLLPPREKCVGVYYPKARRHIHDAGIPATVNKTYRLMPLVAIHELLTTIEETKAKLPAVTAPTLIVQSIADLTVKPASAEYIFDNLGSAEKELYWLEKSGHLLPLDCEREQVFAKTADFLAKGV